MKHAVSGQWSLEIQVQYLLVQVGQSAGGALHMLSAAEKLQVRTLRC